jgi:predicted Zn-dependent protease
MDQKALAVANARAAALLAADPAAAEREVRQTLKAAPADPGARLILASALRRQGNPSAALAVIQPLAKAYPSAATTQFELGMALADIGKTGPAIDALRTSTSLNRENPDAWRALGALLFDGGDARGAEAAFAQHARALLRDPRLKAAAEALYRGQVDEAIATLRSIMATRPNDPRAKRLLAEAYAQGGQHAAAAALLSPLVEQTPGDDIARAHLARELFHLQRIPEALSHLDHLLAGEPENPAYRNLAATCLALVGESDRAIAHYEALVQAHPNVAPIWANYGQVLRTVGRADDAAAAFRRSISLDPRAVDAYLGLANLKVAPFSDSEVVAMQRIADEPGLMPRDRAQLDFALGKALEDRRQFAASFDYYAAGASLRRGETLYDADALAAEVARDRALLTSEFFAARARQGATAPDPIFIVGLPRSGSTLIEQILASHPAIEGTTELPDIDFIAERFAAYPDDLARLTATRAIELGEEYLRAARAHRKLGRPFFIDKMPNNFRHLGLIQLILPNAKIIDARRHPMATCFSCFKQHFAQGHGFSYDLADVGRYYRDYVDLMAHFDVALPGRVQRVIYEDLVENPEREVRALLEHLGLPFAPECLTFYETERTVLTVSSEQVRRPIFREGLDQWRNYEPWLGSLEDALGPALETWRAIERD